MMNRQFKICVFLSISLLAATISTDAFKVQTPAPATVSPLSSPSPIPTETLSLEERLASVENQVDELGKESGISRWKDTIDIIQSGITILAIIIGSIWSYSLFVRNRQRYPRAAIRHDITHIPIGNEKLLLRINVNISNSGDVLLSLFSLETRILQVTPLPTNILDSINGGEVLLPKGETEIDWPLIDHQQVTWEKGTCEVEPGESQQIPHDFIIDGTLETVIIYSHLKNEVKPKHKEIGWDWTTIYNLHESSKMEDKND